MAMLHATLVALVVGTRTGAADDGMSPLYRALRDVVFYNSDVAHHDDQYVDVKMNVSYNEPDNVTCV